jgi:hypothetical protein
MANKQKKTQKEMYNELLALCQTDEQREFVESRLEQLAKKSASTSKKEKEKQEANAYLGTVILNYMKPNEKYTITDLIKSIPELQDYTNQRITAIMSTLKEQYKVYNIQLKGRSYYCCMNNEDEGE